VNSWAKTETPMSSRKRKSGHCIYKTMPFLNIAAEGEKTNVDIKSQEKYNFF
jgi:hypothetical protein